MSVACPGPIIGDAHAIHSDPDMFELPLLIAAVGVGALAAFALWSPRPRAALMAADESALDAGSRLASRSIDQLQELVPQQAVDAVSGLAATARSATDGASSAAGDRLHDTVGRARDLMHELPARARRFPR